MQFDTTDKRNFVELIGVKISNKLEKSYYYCGVFLLLLIVVVFQAIILCTELFNLWYQ